MSKKIEKMMRARFWELDGRIKASQAKLKPLEDERDSLAAEEAALRAKVKAIQGRRQKIISDSRLVDLARERSGCSGFLKGKTGAHP